VRAYRHRRPSLTFPAYLFLRIHGPTAVDAVIARMRQTRSAIFLIFGFAAFVLAGRAQNSLADRWRAIAADASGRVGVAALIG
jgi:hypothetical protein